jgi:hypothetical protein
MRHQFRPVLVAICSCVLGLLIGVAAQIVHVRNFERAQSKVTEEFESRGESPPLLIDLQKPSFYPMIFSAALGAVGTMLYVGYHLVASRSSHET